MSQKYKLKYKIKTKRNQMVPCVLAIPCYTIKSFGLDFWIVWIINRLDHVHFHEKILELERSICSVHYNLPKFMRVATKLHVKIRRFVVLTYMHNNI